MNDELTGTLVLVHSHTDGYPAFNQGMIGIITAEDLQENKIYVGFGMSEQMPYTTNVLLVLRRPSHIYAAMMRNAAKLETNDFKALFKLCLLLDSGLTRDKRAAIEMACQNETVRNYSMRYLSETYGGGGEARQLQIISLNKSPYQI